MDERLSGGRRVHRLPRRGAPAGREGPARHRTGPIDARQDRKRRPIALGELLLALGLLALGGFIAVETATLRSAPLYSHVGPRLFPALIAGGIILIGLLLARQAVRGGWPKESETAAEPIRWLGFGLISAGLLLQMLLIERLGFVLSSSILFWFVAAGFGSRRPVRDAAVGIVLAVLTFLGFTRGLDLSLPAGILGGIL